VRRGGGGGILVVLLGLCLAVGCATPEARYRVLSLFFDEVPLPESMQPPAPPEEAPVVETAALTRARRPRIEWVMHEPECEECHSSKATKLPFLPAPELCWECHDEEDFVEEVSHGPFAAGACLECHSPHKSPNPTLLVLAVPDLCGKCHDATTFPGIDGHRSEQGDDCVECHDPHAGPSEYMLASDGPGAPGTPTAIAKTGSPPAP
jgi:predicted CXXCH cytochrome family protein